MGSVPTGRVEVVKIAVLLSPGPGTRVAVPSRSTVVVGGNDSVNCTVPVGAAKFPVKVAVKVTGWPWMAGLSDEVRVAVVVSGDTVMVTWGEVEGAWVRSPE